MAYRMLKEDVRKRMLLDGDACDEYEDVDRDLKDENHTEGGCIRLYCNLLKRRLKVWN